MNIRVSKRGRVARGPRAAARRYWWVPLTLSIALTPLAGLGLMVLVPQRLGSAVCVALMVLAVLLITVGALRSRRSCGPPPPRPRATTDAFPPVVVPAVDRERMLAA